MRVDNKDTRIWNVGDHVTLLPGVNEVEDAVWAKAEPSAKNLVDAGLVEPKPGVSVKNLWKHNPHEAVALVKATVDRKLLEGWAETEKRRPVLDAINGRLDEITPKPSDKKAGKKDEGDEKDE